MMGEAQEKLERLLAREGTNISWSHLTFNPWIGCTRVSPACDHCYAATLATARLGVEWGPGAERRRTAASTWNKVRRWNRVAGAAGAVLNVFCASLADVFDNEVDDQWRLDLAEEVRQTPNLRWMLLTKRIGNARAMLEAMFPDGVPANVALGVTICNQQEADRDLPKALSVKAGLGIYRLFVSAEPLLSHIDMSRYLKGVDLLIVGGESGKDARPMHWMWIKKLYEDCRAEEVRFHFKQWGEWHPGQVAGKEQQTICATVEDAFRVPYPTTGSIMSRVGVAAAGHLLSGHEVREHFKSS